MYCSKCGKKLNDNDNFCPQCGTVSILSQNTSHQNNANLSQTSNSKGLKVAIILLMIPFILMFLIYYYRVKQATKTMKIPYANQTINPGTVITDDMISYVDLPISFVIGRYYQEISEIKGKCSNYNTIIAKGSLFYIDLLGDCRNS